MSTEQQEVTEELQHVAVLANGAGSSAGFTSLGKCLQQARQQAGYTPQQIADEMHLDVKFIESVERDRFKELGAPVFVKGHLRRYARLVNLNEALLQGLYESLRDPPVAVDPIPVSMNSIPDVRRLVPNWAMWVAAGAFVVVSVGTMMNRLNSRDDLQAAANPLVAVKSYAENIAKSPL